MAGRIAPNISISKPPANNPSKTCKQKSLLANSGDDILTNFLDYANSPEAQGSHFKNFEQRTTPNAIRIQKLGQEMEATLNHELETIPLSPPHNTSVNNSSDWGSQSPIYPRNVETSFDDHPDNHRR